MYNLTTTKIIKLDLTQTNPNPNWERIKNVNIILKEKFPFGKTLMNKTFLFDSGANISVVNDKSLLETYK